MDLPSMLPGLIAALLVLLKLFIKSHRTTKEIRALKKTLLELAQAVEESQAKITEILVTLAGRIEKTGKETEGKTFPLVYELARKLHALEQKVQTSNQIDKEQSALRAAIGALSQRVDQLSKPSHLRAMLRRLFREIGAAGRRTRPNASA